MKTTMENLLAGKKSTCYDGHMKTVLVIDDVKKFTFPADCEVFYARTLKDGYEWLSALYAVDELWLDHDLGGEDTIRPLVLDLAEDAFNEMPYEAGLIVICSLNIVGVEWIESTLSPYYRTVRCTSPEQLLALNGNSSAVWY
jgi:hypothetical protein